MSITGVVPPVDVILLTVPETLVTLPPTVANVPLVGKVTFVAPVIVKVLENGPTVARLPPRVNVDVPLLTPVPPLEGGNIPLKFAGVITIFASNKDNS